MQFIFNEDSNLYGYADGEDEFEFPSNIKQMGSIDDNIKIYMEDYVYTYLYQYAKSGGNKEKLAALVGRHMLVDGKQVIVISGAIQGKSTVQEKGVETFTQDTWNYINTQLSIYFRGLTLVGWVHTQPGFGAFLMARDEIFHKEYFKSPWQALFVIDPLDKMDTFFVHNYENTGMKPAKGYFIYYDKNENMQEYMLDNSLVRPKVSEEETPWEEETTDTQEKRRPSPEERMDAAKKIRRVLKNRAEEAESQTKKRYSLLTGISTILCVVCFIMGISLMNNLDRIKRLETEVVTVKTSYTNIVERINQSDTAAAFAAQQVAQQQQEIQAPAQPEVQAPAQPEVQTPVQAEAEAQAPAPAQSEGQAPVQAEAQAPAQSEVQAPVQQEVKEDNEEIPAFYIIEEGDTLGHISEKFYHTGKMVSSIMEENGIEDPDKIIIGKKLILPRP